MKVISEEEQVIKFGLKIKTIVFLRNAVENCSHKDHHCALRSKWGHDFLFHDDFGSEMTT